MKKRIKNLNSLKLALKKKQKLVCLLAPSFIADFDYPQIIHQLRTIGFDKIVELTFGAKMINREYHKILKNQKNKLFISSVCPGIVETIKNKYPQYKDNLISVLSPMTATAKICKKIYPKHKTVFISPCQFKKIESDQSNEIDFVIDYNELREILKENKKEKNGNEIKLDKFYNDYTKIYPLSGGLSKTAHLNQVLKKGEEVKIDGIIEVEKFLEKPNKKVRFMDVTFCKGGCLGGPCLLNKNMRDKKRRLLKYLQDSEKEKIEENKKGLIKKAIGINFIKEY
jgi:iron only hydrogenase large subunit-like protein